MTVSRAAIICSILAAFIAEISGNDTGCDFNKVCLPGPRNIAQLAHRTVTATSTCGNPASEYCRVKPLNNCFMCYSGNHTVDMMTDDFLSTRWQSETWWDWYTNNNNTDEPLRVNVTISFNKSYVITGEILLIFKSLRPIKMILEKSDDKGKTWTALQYYAEDCIDRFNVSSTPVESISEGNYGLHCVEEFSDFIPQEDGEVSFDFLRRYSKSHFWNGTLQEYLTATDIRVQMLHPGTEGQDNLEIKTREILRQYYYSIGDLRVIARCQCHGHAKYCDYPDRRGKDCDCSHNTEGEDCERCKPLHNNKTWRPATSESEPNVCEECQCYNHATSCHYNESLGHGVCDNCDDNTTGVFCDKCVDKFYRNMSKALQDPEVCLPCDCFMLGITNNGTCNQTTGQCECKLNVTGQKCDACEDTFWGFDLPPVGDCQECSCNGNGTMNGTLSCNQDSGECLCKDNIHQRTCSECRDGFFLFPTSVDADCLHCDCDYGGSMKKICEKENGTCLCQNHIEGERCTKATPGFFVASFDHLKYEAEDAMGSYTLQSYFTGVDQEFTGRGYGKIGQHQFITFFFNNDGSSSFNFSSHIVIRYTSMKEDNVTLRLSVSSCNSSNCHEINNFTIVVLSPGTGLAWISAEPVYFHEGLVYYLNLTFIEGMYANSSVEIDSLILLPNVHDVRIYKMAQSVGSVHGMSLNQIEDCWNNSTTISGLLNSPGVCNNVTFSVMADVFDGALPCACNRTGSENGTICMQLGGQCRCKPGVTGRSCDRCLPGYFNFTDSGCTACNCNNLGSSDLVCDPVTGQCPCRAGVVTRTCSRCNASYYGFHTGKGCVECGCNASGSADLQCDSNGVCPCKNSTSSTKCDMCRSNFFNFTSEGCQPCNCHEGGSTSLQCHLRSGICPCKANAEGNKCERCKSGTYNSDPDNPDGCSPCFCYGRSSHCSSSQGFVKSYIIANFSSNLDTSPTGISFQDLGEGFEINFTTATFVKLTFRKPFQGNQLHSYSQLLMATLDYSSINDSVLASWNVTLKGINNKEAYFNVVPLPSISNKEYYIRLHEHYTLNNLTAYELQSILVDIESIQFHGSFMSNGVVTISFKLVSAMKGVGEEVGYVENCTCPNNYTELSCGFCNSGYTRLESRNSPDPLTPCVLCSCSGRSTDCYPENGTCYNCRTGSEGEHCEGCQPGVDNTTDCRRCIPGFFGLTPSSNGCQECDCVLPNTIYGNNSVCDETSGQCGCKPRIGGRQCDRCYENAYNTSRGCVDCPECYRLVYEEVKRLRVSATALGSMINRLRNGSIGDASFAQRLSNAESHVVSFVTEAEEARDIEKNLMKEIKGLNNTLNNLEHILMQELTPDMNELSSNLTSILEDKNTTEHLITLIRDAVYYSHNVLNMSLDPSVREAEVIVEQLSLLVPRFSDLESNFTAIASHQNATGFEIEGNVRKAEYLINQTRDVAGNAVSEQHDLETVLENLTIRVDDIKDLGEQMNSSRYELYMNASKVLARANESLSEVMRLALNNTGVLRQIEAATIEATARTQEIVSRTQNITLMYSNLTIQVELAVKEAESLMRHAGNTQRKGQAILDEARMAREEALDAVQLARKTFTDAQEMLQILQNFESTSTQARQLAEISLNRVIEYNQTSWSAIENAQRINASLQATLASATYALDQANQAWNISYSENQGVSIIHDDASRLSQDASQSKYTIGYFSVVEQNVSSVNSTSQRLIEPCKQNYSSTASNVLQDAYSAKNKADQANAAAKNLTMKLDRVVQEFRILQPVNMSRLFQLNNDIQKMDDRLKQKNVTDIIKELKRAKDEQQILVDTYREKVKEKRLEIAEFKLLYASLSSVTCETPSPGTMLET